MPIIPSPISLLTDDEQFVLRAYSKYDLRMLYGESADTFRKYYLNDPETLADLKKLDYKKTRKVLNRKMVEVIVRYHGTP